MNYNISNECFHKSGHVTKETQSLFNKETLVISYLKNRERSSGFKHLIASGHLRTCVLVNFIARELNITTTTDLDTMLCIAYDNFDTFKKWITESIANGTIFMTSREYKKYKSNK